MRQLVIDGLEVNDSTDCYVIAEIGHNHQGDIKQARELILAAKNCGANAAKLQKRDNRALFTSEYYHRPYDNPNSFGATYGDHREFLEFGESEYRELQAYSKEIGITFFSTAFDFPSADFLAKLDMPAYKIASGDLKNIPLIKYIAAFGKPLVISTGGGTMEDIDRVYEALTPINKNFTILQCTASYPAQPEEMNLRVISTLRERFPDTVIGLSDHFSGISMAPAAFVLGARVMEKHFTLNRAMKGTDHAFSLEPIGLKKLVRDLKRVRKALGDGIKVTQPVEAAPLIKMGKKLVAARDLEAGHTLTREDVAIKSPGDGLPPYMLETVLGRKIVHPMACDQSIHIDYLND
ncbi:MAG: N-acetylneuraminate synthase family protein [Spirochaetales bacterium]|nr:N-acetylneuraminate synthase family protein [Spirochaetales bacterium]